MTPQQRRDELEKRRFSRHLPDWMIPGSQVSVNMRGQDPYAGVPVPGADQAVVHRGRTVRPDPRMVSRPIDKYLLDPLLGKPGTFKQQLYDKFGKPWEEYAESPDVLSALKFGWDVINPIPGAEWWNKHKPGSAVVAPLSTDLANSMSRFSDMTSEFKPSLSRGEDTLIDELLGGNTQGLTKRQLAKLGHMQMTGASDEEIQSALQEMRSSSDVEEIPYEDDEGFLSTGEAGSPYGQSDGINYASFAAPQFSPRERPRPAVSDTERARLEEFTKDEYWRDRFGTDQAVGTESSFDPDSWGALSWIGRGAAVPLNMLDHVLAQVGMGPEFQRQRTMMALEAQETMFKNQMNDNLPGMMNPQTEEERRVQQIQAAMTEGARQAWGINSSEQRPSSKQAGWLEFMFANRMDRDKEYMNQRARTIQAKDRADRLVGQMEKIRQQGQDAMDNRREEHRLWQGDEELRLGTFRANTQADNVAWGKYHDERSWGRQAAEDRKNAILQGLDFLQDQYGLMSKNQRGNLEATRKVAGTVASILGNEDLSESTKGALTSMLTPVKNTAWFGEKYEPDLGQAELDDGSVIDITPDINPESYVAIDPEEIEEVANNIATLQAAYMELSGMGDLNPREKLMPRRDVDVSNMSKEDALTEFYVQWADEHDGEVAPPNEVQKFIDTHLRGRQ